MRRALELAERGRGHVEPNLLVRRGAGARLWPGRSAKGGIASARRRAVRRDRRRSARLGDCREATLFVTLEPCCHHGKTPPCTDAILRTGIGRVIAALEDPFPQVAGRGAKILREAGVPIEFGIGADAPWRQNAATFDAARPRSAARARQVGDDARRQDCDEASDSKRTSGDESPRRRPRAWRCRMDELLVGIGTCCSPTIRALTARPPGSRTPCRVVLDRHARLPLTSQLVRTCTGDADDGLRRLRSRGFGCDAKWLR